MYYPPSAPGAFYVPLSSVYPAMAGLRPAEMPPSGPCSLNPELWAILDRAETLSIRQHVKVLPKKCCTCPPCVPQENSYSIYAGLNRDDAFEIMRADEVSDDCNRCCCKPYHPFRIELRQFIPVPGQGVSSDMSHLTQDFANDFNSWAAGRKAEELKMLYKQQPAMVSIVRNNGQRCCRCPCKMLDTFVCCACCQDGVTVVGGPMDDIVNGKPGERGLPFSIVPENVIGKAIQPILGGVCTPTLHLSERNDDTNPYGKLQGPYCFGGWSEMCCDFNFPISYFKSPNKTGDIALVKKLKPSSFGLAVTELISDADVYSLQFNLNTKLTVPQKLTSLAAQILIDYMLFDGSTEKCTQDDSAIYCHMFYCSCFGCLWPCDIVIPKNSGSH